jgi:hypothetical protein
MRAAPLGPVRIDIDGCFEDWAVVSPLLTDAEDAPDSAGPDWLDIRVTNDATSLYVRFGSANPFQLDGSPAWNYSRMLIFVDTDANPATGYAVTGEVGSELLVAGAELYRESAGVFNAGLLGPLAAAPRIAVIDCELAIPLARVFAATPGARELHLWFLNDETWDGAPGRGFVRYTLLGF